MVGVAVFAYRSAMSAQRDRLWVAMAREAAHQMGTPLTSLQGWIERVRSRATPPPGLADHLSADAERLDRWLSASSESAIPPSGSRWDWARWPIASPDTTGPDCRDMPT